MMNVLFVIDVIGWAFDITATNLIKHLPYNCSKVTLKKFNNNMLEYAENNDRIHFMNWKDGLSFAKTEEYKKHRSKVSGGVCSFNSHLRWKGTMNKHIGKIPKIVCISNELYEATKKLHKKIFVCPNGVDTEMFKPNPIDHDGFVVGWMGQRTHGGYGEVLGTEGLPMYDMKGYKLVLDQLTKNLDGVVKFKINSKNYKNRIKHKDIPAWYEDIDLFICTSIYEGGPMSVLEAASCGLPVLATKTGISPEFFPIPYLIDAPRDYRTRDRVVATFTDKIKCLRKRKDKLGLIGELNREKAVKKYDWSVVAKQWFKVFE